MASLPKDIFFTGIAALNAKLRAREFSCQDLTDTCCDLLETEGTQYNALVLSLRKQALKQAKEVDDEMKRERFRGPLQGLPFGVKDLLSVANFPTTWGAKPFAGQVFDYDATVITKLSGTGGIPAAKLSMVELAGGGGYNSAAASATGPGLNPWNKAYWSGGSSSGSAAAVAAGLVPYALGSETSGSIITPAAYCGVTGLRPTYGLVSRHGAMPLSWTLDKIGVLAHSADDCGYVLRGIAGSDDQDRSSARKSFYYAPQYGRLLKDLKIGYAPVDFSEWPVPSARDAFQKALAVMKSLGSQFIEMELPDFPYGLVIGTIIDAEGASVFEEFIRSEKVEQLADQSQINGLKASLQISSLDYLKAMRIRSQIQRAFHELFSKVDLLLAPSRFGPADRADQPFDEQKKSRPPRPQKRGIGAALIQASNLAGLPALSVPCGFADGLPLGLSIAGPAFSENTLLSVGREFQKLTDFQKRRPPVLSLVS